jgi:hypothetical protein
MPQMQLEADVGPLVGHGCMWSQTKRPSSSAEAGRSGNAGVATFGAHAWLGPQLKLAAQHRLPADGALRRQARGFFEGWKRLDTSTALSMRRR